MIAGTGPESLLQIEDRVLFHLVDLTGDRPMRVNEGVTEADLARRLADDLEISPEFPASGEFHASSARMMILAAVESLEREGLVDAQKVMGPWLIRPTREGRRKVNEWREEWQRRRGAQEKEAELRILEELDRQRRDGSRNAAAAAGLDVDRMSSETNLPRNVLAAGIQRLVDLGQIAYAGDGRTDGENLAITDEGVRALATRSYRSQPVRDAAEAWNEVAKLRRRLEIAERTIPSLIHDEELHRRCVDLLTADGDFDRVIREASVVLENRVRAAIGASPSLVGVALMECAFSAKEPRLRLSDIEAEQLGAMQMYRGVMAFFRNPAGHKLIEGYDREDALRFVTWVDLLLCFVRKAMSARSTTARPSQ